MARNFEGFGQQGLTLDRDLVLPDFAVPLGVQVAEAMLRRFQPTPEQVEAYWREHSEEAKARGVKVG